MAALWFDLRQVLRAIRRQPVFFTVAALTLGVGFAAHFAAFGIVDRLLLSSPAHVQSADRVFRLHVERADIGGGRFLWWQTPYKAYQDLREQTQVFTAMAAYRATRASLGTGADARMVSVTFADHHYFPLLGVSASRGRVFGPGDNLPPSGNPVLVLSDAYWRRAHGADEGAIGQTVRIGAQTFTIIGIAPPGFTGDTPDVVDAWAPLHAGAMDLPPVWTTSVLYRSVNVLVRLSPGTPAAMAADQAGTAYRQLSEGTPAADATARVVLGSLAPGRTSTGELTREGHIALWLEGVSLLVLLVAMANVINLQMSRAAQQRREMAVRAALGAGRGRLLAKLGLEVLTIAIGASAVGGALTYWSTTALHQLLLPGVPGVIDSGRFGLVAIVTIVAVTVLVAGAASLGLSGNALVAQLKTGRGGDGFTRARVPQALLVAQVVMSALLLVGAGLFLKSIVKVGELQFGIDTNRVLAITLPIRSAGYSDAAAEAFYARAVAELAAIPGVEQAAAAQSTPFAPSQRSEIALPGVERSPVTSQNYPTYYTITPSFFQTMGMRITRGRGFTDDDRSGSPPVIILEGALATALWPGQDPIGKCLIIGTRTASFVPPCREVVGVATNTRRFVGTPNAALRYYVPLAQRVNPAPPQALFARAAGDPAALVGPVRSALLRVAGDLPYAQIRVLRELAEPESRPWRLGSTLFAIFGAAALFVATAGVYALLSVIVAQRSREIGVRLALGASPRGTLVMVVRQSLGWVATGLVAGLVTAMAMGRFIRPMLFETSPYDTTVFVATASLLLSVAVVASFAPAIRASRVDPNITLRAE
jgi:putative ABC transport system permease protein